jgi:GT2 family glycosyltransferase
MSLQVAAVIPCYNAREWLERCLRSLATQSRPFSEVVVVDDASTDGSADWLRENRPDVRLVALERNRGFAAVANRGVFAVGAECEAVALVNTDVELSPDWLARTAAVLEGDREVAAVATKMVSLREEGVLDDCGDVLRRDGACEQRGHGWRDDGRWDTAQEVFGACAGAALYRRSAFAALGGFEERFVAYLEDVDLALRLRLAGWRCRYEPVVARHWGSGAGGGGGPARPIDSLVERNTLLLCARAFPLRWWVGPVLYRQVAWAVRAAQGGQLGSFARGAAAALPLLPAFVRERSSLRRGARVPIEQVVPKRPFRGPRAGGHPDAGF